ncbi:MAG TPA: aminomethyltransferase beta-barrel domain-containing protein, partial [Thermoanaerobaculia bacterium]|nr:aminomethyltransferase beta-barrel domain-containing protein [Thermoanaerobaculia bacterium]
RFDFPVRAVAPGQSCVFYNGDVVLGGGVLKKSTARASQRASSAEAAASAAKAGSAASQSSIDSQQSTVQNGSLPEPTDYRLPTTD